MTAAVAGPTDAGWLSDAIGTEIVAVREVAPEQPTFTSRILRLRASRPDGTELPLFVKVTRPELDRAISRSFAAEIEFYERIAPTLGDLPLLAYRGGVHDERSAFGCVVLDDVTETHSGLEWPVAPRPRDAARAVAWLARLHAARWGDPRLPEVGEPTGAAAAVAATTTAFLRSVVPSRTRVERRRLARAVASIELWWPVPDASGPRTLLFGDAHFSNFLYPRRADGEVLPCDWQHWTVGRPGYDLANAIALHWPPERRDRLELRLLRVYRRTLEVCGVQAPGWDALLGDYRLHALRHTVAVPAWQWSVGVPATVWWQQLDWGLAAWDDLELDELLLGDPKKKRQSGCGD